MGFPIQLKNVVSCIAHVDIAANLAVALGTDAQEVKLPAADGDLVIGIADDSGASANKEIAIVTSGFCLAKAGAVIDKGALVMAKTTGKVVTATAAKYACGVACDAAGADGDLITVKLLTIQIPA